MKRIFIALSLFVAIVGCTNSKPAQSVENSETSVEATDTVDEQTKQKNMEEVQAFLKACNAFFVATADADQPRVRPFGVSEIINGCLYIMTGKKKQVFKQLSSNGKFEICALKPTGAEWVRISGTLVSDDALEVKKEFLERNPSLQSMYKADDDNIAVLYITHGTACFNSFGAPEKKVQF